MDTADLAALITTLQNLVPAIDDADRIERVGHFETLKAVIGAGQLTEAVAFADSQIADQAVSGVPSVRQGRGVAEQIALARRISPWQVRRWLGWGRILTRELPATWAQLCVGRTTEHRALLVARETVWLAREDRAEVDTVLAPDLHRLSDRHVENRARAHASRLDPAGACERRRIAETERRVTLRPRPDTMSSLSATNTVERGVQMWATLRRDAHHLIGTGDNDGRTRDQLMADLLYDRVTGQSAASGPAVAVEVMLTVDSLLSPDASSGGTDSSANEPAQLLADGLTPVTLPAPLARQLIGAAPRAWIRRLFTSPGGGALLTMEARGRLFTAAQRDFLRYRDQYCSTPYCGSPIRHSDHALPVENGGATSITNGNGKCVACNHAKQADGWRQVPVSAGYPGETGAGTIHTPTGHRYPYRPPSPPGYPPHSPIAQELPRSA